MCLDFVSGNLNSPLGTWHSGAQLGGRHEVSGMESVLRVTLLPSVPVIFFRRISLIFVEES